MKDLDVKNLSDSVLAHLAEQIAYERTIRARMLPAPCLTFRGYGPYDRCVLLAGHSDEHMWEPVSSGASFLEEVTRENEEIEARRAEGWAPPVDA